MSCQPDCLTCALDEKMEDLEELRASDDPDYEAILNVINEAKELKSEIDTCLMWINVKLTAWENRALRQEL